MASIMEKIKKEYEAKLDGKNRLTVREAKYSYYKVSEFEDGTIVLKPRVLIDPDELSKNTLETMDKSVMNLKKRAVSQKLDISKYLEIIEKSDEI